MNQLGGAVLGRSRELARPAPGNASDKLAEKADGAPIAFIDLKLQYARIATQVSTAIQDVVTSGRYVMGPVIEELERRLAVYAGVGHAIGVSSGTEALFIPLLAKKIGAGDAVFMPAFTFTATAEVAVLAGATPVFVDCDRDSFNMSATDLEAKIASVLAQGRLRPAAVVAVDLFGQPADYKIINALAAAHDMLVIADAAQSFGAEAGNRRVGSLAQVTATSFYPSKPLGCYGDGGAIFTDDQGLDDIMRSVRSHGEGASRYDIVRIGVNGRLDAMQAAVLLVKLDIFDDELACREVVARAYDERLDGHVETPWRVPGMRSAWAQYTLKVERRDELAAHLKARGIPSMIYYPMPMHFQPAYADYGDGPGSMPVSESLSKEVLSLPFHPYLTEGEIDRVTGAIADFYGA
ncbi:DegT/DnrJ/EryC1/StrS aminotransferase [hydrothermal vent metagenome]|uniref:DegT/DnrJ/EryC1/StrS aminotransferase n=1 Tax=hydrothermal vent metagenome TaxID=652676 RepID=A0A3B0SWW9_9ZZZZ